MKRDIFEAIDREALVGLAQRLIRIPSVNPPGDYGEIAAAVREELTDIGLETLVMEGAPGKPNVVGLLRSLSPSPRTVLLSTHMDVVGPGDEAAWRFPPFSATVADGAIWGRGAIDIKGPMAAQIAAVRAVAETGGAEANVMIAMTVDDETAGTWGAKYLIERGIPGAGWPRPFVHVLGEPNGLNVTHVFKGRVWLRVKLEGRSAHGGAPQKGVNAIEKMAALSARLKKGLPGDDHPLLGPDTVNLGTIAGGTRVNAVPDFCEATFDFRSSTLTADEAAARFRAVADALGREDPDFRVAGIEVTEARDPLAVDPGREEIRLMTGAIEAALGRPARFEGSLSAGDAYHTIRNGIPGAWLGPGDASLFHAPNERISVDDLMDAARVYAALCASCR